MSAHIEPSEYLDRYYEADFEVFGGDMMCGFTLTDSMMPPKRARFRGFAEFVVCQFELNFLSQAIYTHALPVYPVWRRFSAPFADPRRCFLGHGMGSHMPHSILRFAQQPCAAPGTPPLALGWDILRSYTAFFIGDYLARFVQSAGGGQFAPEAFLRAVAGDYDCTACVLTPAGWESKHVLDLAKNEPVRS